VKGKVVELKYCCDVMGTEGKVDELYERWVRSLLFLKLIFAIQLMRAEGYNGEKRGTMSTRYPRKRVLTAMNVVNVPKDLLDAR